MINNSLEKGNVILNSTSEKNNYNLDNNKDENINKATFKKVNIIQGENKTKRNSSQPKMRMKEFNIENEKNTNEIINRKKTTNIQLKNGLLISDKIDSNNDKDLISHNSSFLTNIENEEGNNGNNENKNNINIPTENNNTNQVTINQSNSRNNNSQESNEQKKKDCLYYIIFIIDIIIIYLLVRINKLTKGNPLDNIVLGNPDTLSNSSQLNSTKLNNILFNKFNTYSDYKNKRVLRNSDDYCRDLNKKIEENKYHLDKVFNLKFNMINKMSKVMIIIYYVYFGFLIIIFFLIIVWANIKDNLGSLNYFLIILIIVILITGLINFISLIIMLVNYYKGYSTDKFLEYYEECLNKDLKPPISNIYDKLYKLKIYFKLFAILKLIDYVLKIILNYD